MYEITGFNSAPGRDDDLRTDEFFTIATAHSSRVPVGETQLRLANTYLFISLLDISLLD